MPDINDLNKEITIITEEITKIKKDMQEKISNIINNIFSYLPGDISAISWYQYTPYFNDGDPCVNSIGEVYVISGDITREHINKISENPYIIEEMEEDDEDEAGLSKLTVLNYDDEVGNSIVKFIHSIEDELENIYGTNTCIVLSREFGVTVEQFDCGY